MLLIVERRQNAQKSYFVFISVGRCLNNILQLYFFAWSGLHHSVGMGQGHLISQCSGYSIMSVAQGDVVSPIKKGFVYIHEIKEYTETYRMKWNDR